MNLPYKLYKGDCLEIMPTLEAGSVDAIITDLPYGTTACAWDEVIPFAEMWREVKRVLKSNGVFITTSAQPFTSFLIVSNPEFFKVEWIWRKNQANNFATMKYYPAKKHENIVMFSKGSFTYNPQMEKTISSEVVRRAKATGRSSIVRAKGTTEHYSSLSRTEKHFTETINPSSVLDFDGVPRATGTEHPTQKPVALYEYLINTYTNFGETVLDICMGSGTTIEAAIKTGRKSIGIERDPKYFSIAEKRISQAAQQPALFHATQQSVNPTRADVAPKFDNFE